MVARVCWFPFANGGEKALKAHGCMPAAFPRHERCGAGVRGYPTEGRAPNPPIGRIASQSQTEHRMEFSSIERWKHTYVTSMDAGYLTKFMVIIWSSFGRAAASHGRSRSGRRHLAVVRRVPSDGRRLLLAEQHPACPAHNHGKAGRLQSGQNGRR